ncbi:MAG: N-acetyltransferase family protein [Betaproteobacteria bacterium]|nr:N-acetyltransferase family protein [Betaproteobacteria bacterium]NBY06205.1 N-acetyltransferase family protein [Betaproteobacteria bacterium]
MTPLIRHCLDTDVPAITAIYGHHVLHGTGSFEIIPPTTQEMADRRQAVLDNDLPYLIAEINGQTVGYAYANLFRPRLAYRHTLENSVYVHHQMGRQGLARALMAELMSHCEQMGGRQMIALIGDSNNASSIGLHLALGFQHAGLMRSSGWKHGRWLDTVLMQRRLGPGDATTPTIIGQ